jgi:2-polyprenyl-3-methyl-5-hydroxy-6-metoxy-1,4-benzoquinol methylase
MSTMPLPKDSQTLLKAVMARCGARCTTAEFHAAVNVTFHNFEAEVYDQEHSDMWRSLPREFTRLTQSCREQWAGVEEMSLLDIGCGTGLATDCLLKTNLGPRIKSVDLLDTSKVMLSEAKKRAQGWGRKVNAYEGLLDAIPRGKKYSLIVSSSVLHHVPDLPSFLSAIHQLQDRGGLYIHIQDPNGDYTDDVDLTKRLAETRKRQQVAEQLKRFTPKRILSKLARGMYAGEDDSYCAKTNSALIRSGIIKTPLAVRDIYAVTDIHVQDGAGISIQKMKEWMPSYRLVAQHSYGFFGVLWNELPIAQQRLEEELAEGNALNGFHVAAVWQLQ